jgi:hypothetical protein
MIGVWVRMSTTNFSCFVHFLSICFSCAQFGRQKGIVASFKSIKPLHADIFGVNNICSVLFVTSHVSRDIRIHILLLLDKAMTISSQMKDDCVTEEASDLLQRETSRFWEPEKHKQPANETQTHVYQVHMPLTWEDIS